MHLRDDLQALVVQAVAVEHRAVEVVDDPGVVVRVHAGRLARRGDALVGVPDVVGVGHQHAAGLHRGVLQVEGRLPVDTTGPQLVDRAVLDGAELLGVALDAGAGPLGQAAVGLDDGTGRGVDPADRALRSTQALHLVEVPPGAWVDHQVVAERAPAADLARDDVARHCLADLGRAGGTQARVVGADHRGGASRVVLEHRDLTAEDVGAPDHLLVAGLRGAVRAPARPDLPDVVGDDVRRGGRAGDGERTGVLRGSRRRGVPRRRSRRGARGNEHARRGQQGGRGDRQNRATAHEDVPSIPRDPPL